jgi:hypothetical protein
MAFLRLPPNEEPRPRASAGVEVLRLTPLKESNDMALVHPPRRHGNVYYPSFRKPIDRADERAAFDALTVAISMKQLGDGTYNPQILIALLSAVGVEQ